MRRIVIMEDASEYCRQVDTDNAAGPSGLVQNNDSAPKADPPTELRGVDRSPDEEPAKRKRSNKTHVSASDPDARMARKPAKPTDMY